MLRIAVVVAVAATMVVGQTTASADEAARPQIVVDATNLKFDVEPDLLGANNNKWYDHSQGLWDQDGTPNDDAVGKMDAAGLGLIRYPGGTSANLFNWKRAVGQGERGCQIAGDDLVRQTDNAYGPAEHLTLTRAAGADAQIMVPFANEQPADAADWVEYFNAKSGTNLNGGIAWADVRAEDGYREPLDVTRWEIGNEQDRSGKQRYWMDPDDETALDQYIRGGTRDFTDEPLGRDCDFSPEHVVSNGTAGQRFYFKYGLIKPGTEPTIKVDGTAWHEVADLGDAGPDEPAYVLDRDTGAVTFGDGTHGAIATEGAPVTVDYTLQHKGFVAMYDAMKATAREIGIDIDVCAAWAPRTGEPNLPARMQELGYADRYDCVGMHPYTNFGADFGGDAWAGPGEAHNWHMIGEKWARKMVWLLREQINAHTPADDRPQVTVSEFGALWFSNSEAAELAKQRFPAYSSTMTHALYMASQFINLARINAGWAEGNTVVAEADVLRGVLGGVDTGFVVSAEALARQAMAPAFAPGSQWAASEIVDNPEVKVGDLGAWKVFQVGATLGADGKLRIVVVNRRMFDAQAADVVPQGFAHTATVDVTTVTGDTFGSYQGEGGDNSVRITHGTKDVGGGSFGYTFPKHSVTVLTLTPASPS